MILAVRHVICSISCVVLCYFHSFFRILFSVIPFRCDTVLISDHWRFHILRLVTLTFLDVETELLPQPQHFNFPIPWVSWSFTFLIKMLGWFFNHIWMFTQRLGCIFVIHKVVVLLHHLSRSTRYRHFSSSSLILNEKLRPRHFT